MMSVILSLSLFGLNLQMVEQNVVLDKSYQSSLGGDFFYHVDYTRVGKGETPIAGFSLFDRQHHQLARLWGHDAESCPLEMVFVSDAGWFAGALNQSGKVELTFFDKTGQVRARAETDQPANYALSRAGNYLYISNDRGVQAFDAQGRIGARFGAGAWFLPSPDDRFLALVNRDRLDVFRFGGLSPAATFRLGTFLFRSLAFSASGQYLAVAERSTVALYSLRNPARIWKTEVDPAASLLALCVDDNGRVFAGGEIGRAGFLSVLEGGRELTRQALSYVDSHETINAVALSGARVDVKTTSQRLEFEVEK
jgi:hypothetical protein